MTSQQSYTVIKQLYILIINYNGLSPSNIYQYILYNNGLRPSNIYKYTLYDNGLSPSNIYKYTLYDNGLSPSNIYEVISPVLHLPDGKERFHLYSDTSKYATGSTLYQIQNGKPKLTAYASKRLPEAAKNYSITELEMCGLAINNMSFVHLLKMVDFDA